MGTILVERFGRQVRLTEAGEVLARHAVGVLASLDAAQEEVAAIAGLRAGRVRLMAFPSSSATLVPKALAMVKRRFPEVRVTFSEAEPPESLGALRSGDCDIAVAFAYDGLDLNGFQNDDLDVFVTRKLLDDDVRLVVPADHPLASRESVGIGEVAAEAWIAGCPRCRGHLVSLATAAGFAPNVAFETEDYVAVLGLVAEGLGVAIVPELILRTAHHPHVATPRLQPTPKRTIYAVTTPDLQRVPAVRATLEALSASAIQMSTDGHRADEPVAQPV